MKNLVFAIILFLNLPLWAFDIQDKQLRFRYTPNEGMGEITCVHERIRDLPDWKITCGRKEFAAHVVIREYRKNSAPKMGIEILYMVTDRNFSSPLFTTGTSWVNLKDPSSLHSLTLSQSVENDYALLQLDWVNQ